MKGTLTGEDIGALGTMSFVRIAGPFTRPAEAWNAARVVVDAAATPEAPLEIIGDYVVPPPEGPPSRDFQTLHLDFGLPLIPAAAVDVARFTALHIAADTPPSDAVTRLVPLRSLLAASSLPDRAELVRRFAGYGDSHGAWSDAAGYVEGSLARIVEAALAQTPILPSVKTHTGFLCGGEFTTMADELEFFAQRGVPLDDIATEVRLRPGEVLVFDNLALAHGRRGTRLPGELHQRVFGRRAVSIPEQLALRNRVLAALVT